MGLLIFYVLLALGVSFICSILEAVLLSVTPGFIKTEVSAGKAYATHLEKMKNNLDKPISAILTLNTIAHTMGAAGAGGAWKAEYGDTGEAIFAGVLTFLVLVFSEIIPKTIGAKFWRGLASPSTTLLRWMVVLMTWTGILWALGMITRLLGGGHEGHGVSRSELAAMAELSEQSGQLDNEETKILRNLFMLKSTTVRDIMTPRTVVYAKQQSQCVEEFLKDAVNEPFSRIPVYEKDLDDASGFVLRADVMSSHIEGESDGKTLKDYKRPVPAIPNTMPVFNAFQQLSKENTHIMLVVDEFGGVAGVVTMEDMLETLLGMEIIDEGDRSEDMQALARKLWQKRAKSMGIEVEETE